MPVSGSTRHGRILSLAVGAAALALSAGCHKEAATAPHAQANGKPQLVAEFGRLVLAPVPGHPAAAYFDLTNKGSDAAILTSVRIEGVKTTELHDMSTRSMAPTRSVEVAAGQTVRFSPGGRHVMAFGVDKALKPGNTIKATMVLDGAPPVAFTLKVAAAGALYDDEGQGAGPDGMAGMPGMAGMAAMSGTEHGDHMGHP